MKDFTEAIFGILIAFILYSIFSKISFSLVLIFNAFSLVVLYFALIKGEVFGAGMGTICGLVQDSFSLGVFGIGGLSKTIMGFIAGYISRKINVTPFLRNFVFIFIMISLELILWAILYSFIFEEKLYTRRGILLFQPLITALLGGIIFRFIPKLRRKASVTIVVYQVLIHSKIEEIIQIAPHGRLTTRSSQPLIEKPVNLLIKMVLLNRDFYQHAFLCTVKAQEHVEFHPISYETAPYLKTIQDHLLFPF